jgi:hypothetical protein
VEHDGHTMVDEQAKAGAFFQFFDSVLWELAVRSRAINMEALRLPCLNLQHLAARFTEEEVWVVIRSLPMDKALGSDDFSARFLQVAWPIIREDIMVAFDAF